VTVAVQVVEIDPHDEEAFDAWFSVMHATDMERWPDKPDKPDKPGWQRVERLAMAHAVETGTSLTWRLT
jgi:hypothetical protein